MRTTAEIAKWREENPDSILAMRGAYLRGAYLGGANEIYLLNMYDPRGYLPYAQVKNGVIMIGSGCRYFTLEEAKEHWGEDYQGDREIGDRYLAGLAQLDCDAFRAWVETQS